MNKLLTIAAILAAGYASAGSVLIENLDISASRAATVTGGQSNLIAGAVQSSVITGLVKAVAIPRDGATMDAGAFINVPSADSNAEINPISVVVTDSPFTQKASVLVDGLAVETDYRKIKYGWFGVYRYEGDLINHAAYYEWPTDETGSKVIATREWSGTLTNGLLSASSIPGPGCTDLGTATEITGATVAYRTAPTAPYTLAITNTAPAYTYTMMVVSTNAYTLSANMFDVTPITPSGTNYFIFAQFETNGLWHVFGRAR